MSIDEWLDSLSRFRPQVEVSTPAAEAVRQAREEDDAAVADIHTGSRTHR